jgi:hypothetical protein
VATTKGSVTCVAVAAAVLLVGCNAHDLGRASTGNVPSPRSTDGPDLTAAALGLCLAVAALPNVNAAERAFDNNAHEALHALAAAPGLERGLAARVLESMERVEADFARSAPDGGLAADLQALTIDTDRALQELGEVGPPCD